MNIRLSKEYGVNPSVEQCFVCFKDVGVILFGKINTGKYGEDPEAPRKVCLGPNSEPCNECKKHMEMGVILISIRNGEESEEGNAGNFNPYRTGGWCVVRDEAITRWLGGDNDELLAGILKKRMAFLPDEVWDMIGLPRGESDVDK